MMFLAGESNGFVYAGASDIGRRRQENQDALLIVSVGDGLLCAVADGLGGHPNGRWAANFAVQQLASLAEQSRESGSAFNLRMAFEAINRLLYEAAISVGTPGAATTLVAALLRGDRFDWANVGDSRLYALEGARLKQISRDHNLAAEPDGEPGLANVLTRSVGCDPGVEADGGESVPLGGGLVLASDGLYALVSPDELAAALRADDPGAAVRDLVALANRRGGHDNITVLLVRRAGVG
ncbi:PP2C family protein-serine/threonine phosphatase [Tepidiforma sp.]|uniref:PP2C family protein-serine/threonine phosphatase n=1 Tax=Tepidiforma sp. TaxID=2682230 RepID=UPI002ADE32D0|nr:protein phosphatase 2C domain-containing protein [Tepidiforma sp.]